MTCRHLHGTVVLYRDLRLLSAWRGALSYQTNTLPTELANGQRDRVNGAISYTFIYICASRTSNCAPVSPMMMYLNKYLQGCPSYGGTQS